MSSTLPRIVVGLALALCSCRREPDVDSSKGTTQLEVFALEIQMYGETKNNKKLRVRSASCLEVCR